MRRPSAWPAAMLAFALLFACGTASAATIVDFDNLGFCERVIKPQCPVCDFKSVGTTTEYSPVFLPEEHAGFTQSNDYEQTFGNDIISLCRDGKHWYYVDEQTRQNLINRVWDLIRSRARDSTLRQKYQLPTYQNHSYPCGTGRGCRGSGAGVRGAIGNGRTVNTASSGYMSFELTFDDPASLAPYVIPFIVAAAAPGDFLELSVDNTVYWTRPLADFEIDKLYWAEVPDEFFPTDAKPHLWTFYLGSANAGYSEAIFPATFTADLCQAGTDPSEPDTDGDGIIDGCDNCPNLANLDQADENGDDVGDACAVSSLDTDGDGVADISDQCPNTASGATVDPQGCSAAQRDSDADGVADSIDQCANTAVGATVDAIGCSAAQRDTDGDGVSDSADNCPATAAGQATNPAGCSVAQLLELLRQRVVGQAPGTSLADKVKLAQSYYAAGNVTVTCTALSDFAKQVTAQQGKKISATTASGFIAKAQAIRTLIGCG